MFAPVRMVTGAEQNACSDARAPACSAGALDRGTQPGVIGAATTACEGVTTDALVTDWGKGPRAEKIRSDSGAARESDRMNV